MYAPVASPTGHRKESHMTFALTLALVLALSSAYLFHEWYTGDTREPRP